MEILEYKTTDKFVIKVDKENWISVDDDHYFIKKFINKGIKETDIISTNVLFKKTLEENTIISENTKHIFKVKPNDGFLDVYVWKIPEATIEIEIMMIQHE